jgi:hypothetical protein
MAVKRDYGSFSKACERHFSPMVAPLGMASLGGIKFGRPRGEWTDGLFLQQSQYGDGQFSVTLGFHVPQFDELWQARPGFGLLLGERLGEGGVGRDCWLPGSNLSKLINSLTQFASYLETAMPWFDRVRSLGDLARLFREQNGFGEQPPPSLDMHKQLMAANYGLLLFIAGSADAARTWLTAAQESFARPVYFSRADGFTDEKKSGVRLMKPGTEQLRQMEAIRAVLARLR